MAVDDGIVFCRTLGIFGRREGDQPAVHFIGQYGAGGRKGVDGSGKGRGIGKVHRDVIVGLDSHGNAHYGNIRHFVHAAAADNLCAQKFPGSPVRNQLCDEERRVRIVMCLIVIYAGDADDIIAVFFCGGFRQAGLSRGEGFGKLCHAGAQHARIGCFLTA